MDSVKVALTVTVSPYLAGRVSELAKDEASRASEYARTTVGAVLSTMNAVAAVLARAFVAVSVAETDAETVPFSLACTAYA